MAPALRSARQRRGPPGPEEHGVQRRHRGGRPQHASPSPTRSAARPPAMRRINGRRRSTRDHLASTRSSVAAFRARAGNLANASSATIRRTTSSPTCSGQRVGDGSDALIGGGLRARAWPMSARPPRRATASPAAWRARLPEPATGKRAMAASGARSMAAIRKLVGDGVHAGVDTVAGAAMGLERPGPAA